MRSILGTPDTMRPEADEAKIAVVGYMGMHVKIFLGPRWFGWGARRFQRGPVEAHKPTCCDVSLMDGALTSTIRQGKTRNKSDQ
jgi:hypothetical protein